MLDALFLFFAIVEDLGLDPSSYCGSYWRP